MMKSRVTAVGLGLFTAAACSMGAAAGNISPPTAGFAQIASAPAVGALVTRLPTAPKRGPAPPARDPYERAIDAAVRHGLAVWVETDLAKAWHNGMQAYNTAVARVGSLAMRPGVIGVKIADELGYHDAFAFDEAGMRAFVVQASADLHRLAPGTRVLIDMIVPQLGCAPGMPQVASQSSTCAQDAAISHPAITIAAVGNLLMTHAVDEFDLSTGLLADHLYQSWGIDRDTAQQAAWAEVRRQGWPALTVMQARKALAHPGTYTGSTMTAQRDLNTWADIPRSNGAAVVDLWTWRQKYKDAVVRLLNPGLADNALWDGITARHRGGSLLVTHFSPSSVELSLEQDLTAATQGFSGLFVAAGTG